MFLSDGSSKPGSPAFFSQCHFEAIKKPAHGNLKQRATAMVKQLIKRAVRSVVPQRDLWEEKREHERRALRMRVQVVSQTQQDSFVRPEVCLGRIANISQGGAKLWLPCRMAHNKFWIRFPMKAEAHDLIECLVRWKGGEQDGHPGSVECGVQFAQAMDLPALEWFLRVDRTQQVS
jgi:hypothetical protein